MTLHVNNDRHIKIHDLSVKYADRYILKDVSLILAKSKITAFVGDNGAGKTTFLNVLGGIISPSAGRIDHNLKNPMRTFQTPVLLNRSVADNVVHTAKCLRVEHYAERSLRALGEVDLIAARNRPAHTLSGGQKMRLQIARLIACNSQLWLLDEPYAGLDIASSKKLDAILLTAKKKSCTVFVAVHSIDFVRRMADVVYSIECCRVVKEASVSRFITKRLQLHQKRK